MPQSSTESSTNAQTLQARLENHAKALESLRRQRCLAQAEKFRDEARRRREVAKQIVSGGLQGEEAFRLMGNRGAASNATAVENKATNSGEIASIKDHDFPADDFLGLGPAAMILVLSPERAEAMEKAVRHRPGTTAIQTWPISDKQTLVAYSDLASDWDDICSLATVNVTGHPRLFSLIAIIVGSAFVLGITVFIAVLAGYAVIESVPLDVIHSLFRGDVSTLTSHVLKVTKRFRLRAIHSLHRRFQSGLASLVAFLENMRDVPLRSQPRTIGV